LRPSGKSNCNNKNLEENIEEENMKIKKRIFLKLKLYIYIYIYIYIFFFFFFELRIRKKKIIDNNKCITIAESYTVLNH